MTKPHLYLLMLASQSLTFKLDSWPTGKQSTEAKVLGDADSSDDSGKLLEVKNEKGKDKSKR